MSPAAVDLKTIATTVGKPQNIAFGQQVADSAITLVRDNGKMLPLKSKGTMPRGPSVYDQRGDA